MMSSSESGSATKHALTSAAPHVCFMAFEDNDAHMDTANRQHMGWLAVALDWTHVVWSLPAECLRVGTDTQARYVATAVLA